MHRPQYRAFLLGLFLSLSLVGCGTKKPQASSEQPLPHTPEPPIATIDSPQWVRPGADSIREEMRAVWLTTVYGLDWPKG